MINIIAPSYQEYKRFMRENARVISPHHFIDRREKLMGLSGEVILVTGELNEIDPEILMEMLIRLDQKRLIFVDEVWGLIKIEKLKTLLKVREVRDMRKKG